jgi:hypothetical protein
MHAVAWR